MTPPTSKQIQGRGRPRCGDWRLECVLPRYVLEELMREEIASGLYRTRVAANVLINWAQKSNGNARTHAVRRSQ
jgi:hypothetical protein